MPRQPRPWFRFYSETLSNAKAFSLGEAKPDLFFAWIMLLNLANVTDPRGFLPGDTGDIAFALRKSHQETAEILSELKAQGFIDIKGKRLYMHKWHEWNPDSDANLTKARATRNSRTPKERAKNALRTPKERTDVDVDVDVEEDKDVDREKEVDVDVDVDRAPAAPRNIFRLYDNFMGAPSITPTMRDLLLEAEEKHPPECIEHCFTEAAASSDGRRKWSYVNAILERHRREGCLPKESNNGKRSGQPLRELEVFAGLGESSPYAS